MLEARSIATKSLKAIGAVVLIIIVSFIAGVTYYFALTGALFPQTRIDITDVRQQMLSETELRVIARLKSSADTDFEIDLKFEVKQNDEETQVITLNVIIEAKQEKEFYADFTINPAKRAEPWVQILAQRNTGLKFLQNINP